MNPFPVFERWYNDELLLTKDSIPSACCLSTTGLDGFPNARYVSLKEVSGDAFIVTGPYASRKGQEISKSNRVALAFWWSQTERQVRIQGTAAKIGDHLADKYFSERTRDAQLVAWVSKQGMEINDLESLYHLFRKTGEQFAGQTILRPENWGGYAINPVRIEFMEFSPTRFHNRKLYEQANGTWTLKQLQP